MKCTLIPFATALLFSTDATCNEVGADTFAQVVARFAVAHVVDIPKGKTNVHLELKAQPGQDLDLRLIDKQSGTELVAWPHGRLSSPTAGTLRDANMTIAYSGYNGINGHRGHETLSIMGTLHSPLTVRVLGYSAGYGEVTYEWGIGVGERCGTADAGRCNEALVCKEEHAGDFAAGNGGTCHTESWCMDALMAAQHCALLADGSFSGSWGCKDFTCVPCPSLTPPHSSACPQRWQTTVTDLGCMAFRCPEPQHAGEGEVCGGLASVLCEEGLSCHITDEGPDAAGRCRDYTITQGDECFSDEMCSEGTLCSNFNITDSVVGTTWPSYALCEPAWMLGTFENQDVLTVAAGESIDSTVSVSGLGTAGVNAILDVRVDLGDHRAGAEDLTFEVFAGTTGYDTHFRVGQVAPAKVAWTGHVIDISDLPIRVPGDDKVNGEWTLRLTHTNTGGSSARLQGWTLRVSSRWD